MSEIERPKRVSKPNKRYISEVVKELPKKSRNDSSKAAIQVPVKPVKLLKKKPTTFSIFQKKELKPVPKATASIATGQNATATTAKRLQSLMKAADVAKLITESQNNDVQELVTNEAPKNDQSKKTRLTCNEHKRKRNPKKPKKFTIDCSDVDFINVNDVLDYIRSNIKIDGKKNNIGNQMKLYAEGDKAVIMCQCKNTVPEILVNGIFTKE